MRLGPGSSNLFFYIFFAPQNQGKKASESCQPIVFLIFPIPPYQKEAEKGGRGISLVPGQSVACETSPPRLVSAQINNRRVKASAASAFAADGGWVPCLPQHPTAATAHPCAHLGGKAQATPGASQLWDELGLPGICHGATAPGAQAREASHKRAAAHRARCSPHTVTAVLKAHPERAQPSWRASTKK